MPSNALRDWQADRLPRLHLVDAQCAAAVANAAATPALADENLRGYVVLLAAHFQGFCRDLHSECARAAGVALNLLPAMGVLVQGVLVAERRLDGGNASFEALTADFDRFAFDSGAALAAAHPDGPQRITRLGHLNKWRNYAAHQKKTAPQTAGTLDLPSIRQWRDACDGLAASLDGVLYNQLVTLTGVAPW